MRWTPFVSLSLALGLAGCGGYSMTGPAAPRGPAPLPAAPTAPVISSTLPPPMPADPTLQPPYGTPAPGVAAVDPTLAPGAGLSPAPAAAPTEVRKADLSGGWTLASAGENCQLFMSLTTWSGGYRANTRGCASDELKAVGAWDLAGQTVVLKDASGSPVARLSSTAAARFSGQTEISKRGIQVYR